MPIQTYTLITSKLDYYNVFSTKLSLEIVQNSSLVQPARTRLLSWVGQRDHITPGLADLHWLCVFFWTQFRVHILPFRVIKWFGARTPEKLIPPLLSSPPVIRETSQVLVHPLPPEFYVGEKKIHSRFFTNKSGSFI